MLKLAGALALLFFHLLSLSAEESIEFLRLSSPNPTPTHHELALSLPTHHLKTVSSTVLEAEAWLRSNVLSHYPSSKITHIAVGHNLHCSSLNLHQFQLLLPALKNLHYSLTRWGLEREIKASPSISSQCLEIEPDFAQSLIQSLLDFVQATNSTLLINPSKPTSEISGEVKKFPSLDTKVVRNYRKPISRKLSSLVTMAADPYPNHPIHVAKSPLPPLIGSPFHFPHPSSSPAKSPGIFPAPAPFGGLHFPPCNPGPVPTPAPEMGGEKLWCVAKPSVPVETLQEGIDFACGEGGADCGEIQPEGSCYNPDTVIAHASYAFNSYWQKMKRNGGSCEFGGTAMIINADPSFLSCRFVVT